jgi:hypothetical protein
MKAMRDDGYTTLRMAGSHGDWDVIFYKDKGTCHMAQLKYTEGGKVTKGELNRFRTSPLPEGAAAYLIIYKKGQSNPFRVLSRAERNGESTTPDFMGKG